MQFRYVCFIRKRSVKSTNLHEQKTLRINLYVFKTNFTLISLVRQKKGWVSIARFIL